MKLIKTVTVKGKDYCLLEKSPSFILTNNYYNGASLYDCNLQHVKDIFCFKDKIIHTIFTSDIKNEILFYLREEDKIIYLDLITEKHEIIELGEAPPYTLYRSYYWWEKNTVIIRLKGHDLLKINIGKKQVCKVGAAEVKRDFNEFYVFWEKVKNLCVIESDVLNQIILYQDNELPLVTIKSLITNEEYSCTIPEIDVHETKFNGHTIAFVAEYNLVIKNVISGKEIALKPKRFHRFLRLIFLDETRVVLLSCDESGTGIDFLQLYDISTIL